MFGSRGCLCQRPFASNTRPERCLAPRPCPFPAHRPVCSWRGCGLAGLIDASNRPLAPAARVFSRSTPSGNPASTGHRRLPRLHRVSGNACPIRRRYPSACDGHRQHRRFHCQAWHPCGTTARRSLRLCRNRPNHPCASAPRTRKPCSRRAQRQHATGACGAAFLRGFGHVCASGRPSSTGQTRLWTDHPTPSATRIGLCQSQPKSSGQTCHPTLKLAATRRWRLLAQWVPESGLN